MLRRENAWAQLDVADQARDTQARIARKAGFVRLPCSAGFAGLPRTTVAHRKARGLQVGSQISRRKRSTRAISNVVASVTAPSRAISRSSEMDLTSSHFA
jgi:hypothetical protein